MTNSISADLAAAGWRLENSYSELPQIFHSQVSPTPVRNPLLVLFNTALANELGLDPAILNSEAGAAVFAGNALPPGAKPIAQAYAGHQFGHFTTLGDGRAILLGEQHAPNSRLFDIQLKGPGRTPYSRGGDGRAVLGPMLREYIISEAMHALGIPTTRSLAVVSTGEPVFREETLPGAVLTRVAASHIRVGTFQWAAAQDDPAILAALADYTIQRHFPELRDVEEPYSAMLDAVLDRQAALVAQWLHVGFIHGVMNTDNMALSGETIDYGPCAFLDTYDPATVFSSIDRRGRYAYGNQPTIALWNLARLAESLLPLLATNGDQAVEIANELLSRFEGSFQGHWLNGMRKKLGLFNAESEDSALAQSLLDWMTEAKVDFTNTFRLLASGMTPAKAPFDQAGFVTWRERWMQRRRRQPQTEQEAATLMQAHCPAVIPRNHKVEEALLAAAADSDLEPTRRLLSILSQPYNYNQNNSGYDEPAPPSSIPYQTFCGT